MQLERIELPPFAPKRHFVRLKYMHTIWIIEKQQQLFGFHLILQIHRHLCWEIQTNCSLIEHWPVTKVGQTSKRESKQAD